MGGNGVFMHAHITRLSLAALVLSAGSTVSAQVVEVGPGETLTEADLFAGSFLGQPFVLEPGTVFNINFSGELGTVGESVEFRGQIPRFFDFGGSAVNLNQGGSMVADATGSALSNVVLTAQPQSGVIGSTLFGEGSVVDFDATSLGGLVFGSGSAATINGGLIESLLVGDGAVVQLRGGVVEDLFWSEGASVTLAGGEFTYAGASVDIIPPDALPGDVLTATLSDGSVLIEEVPLSTPLAPLSLASATLPGLVTDPIVVPSELPPEGGLRPGQTLVLQDGGFLPQGYRVAGGTILVEDGVVGVGLVAANADITVRGGSFQSVGLAPNIRLLRCTLRVEGGFLFPQVYARFGTDIDITGGVVDRLDTDSGTVRLAGGVLERLDLSGNAALIIDGGTLQLADAYDSASVEFLGGSISGGIDFFDASTLTIRAGEWPEARDLASDTLVEGGAVGDDATLPEGGSLRVVGGAVGDGLTVRDRGSVEIVGGSIGNALRIENGGTLLISGGSIGSTLNAIGTQIIQNGGHLGSNAVLLRDSSIVISGGTVGDRFGLTGSGTSAELVVRALSLDGVPVPIAPGERLVIDERNIALDAVLADGTPIDFVLNTNIFAPDLDYFSPTSVLTAVGAPPVPCSAADLAAPFATLDLADLVAFVGAFLAGSPTADLNGDGLNDLSDIAVFVDLFTIGCGT